jgi:hypothetical protein
MNNVYCLLGTRLDKTLCKFGYDLDSMVRLTFAKYGVERDHRQARYIVEVMDELMRSGYKMHKHLYNKVISELHRPRPKNELIEVRKKLVIGPRRVLTAFHNKITKSDDVNLEDPRALAAFKAANEILDYFLQLEHDHMRAYLEAAETHLRLQRARRRQQTLQPLPSKQGSPQRAEGTL